MKVRYFVFHNDKKLGPLTFSEIEHKFNQNELYPTDYVYLSEIGDWKPILEFIMIYGPKVKVVQYALQTEGASDPNDAKLDWRRFATGLPAPGWTDTDEPVYPPLPKELTPMAVDVAADPTDVTPPPVPTKINVPRIAPQTPPPRPAPPSRVTKPKPVANFDFSAVAQVNVLPAKACRLQIQVLGEARVGQDLEIVIRALTEEGNLDHDFNERVHLACNQPLRGLEPLVFREGEARIRVHCLTQGAHQFYLTLTDGARADEQRDKSPGSPLSH